MNKNAPVMITEYRDQDLANQSFYISCHWSGMSKVFGPENLTHDLASVLP